MPSFKGETLGLITLALVHCLFFTLFVIFSLHTIMNEESMVCNHVLRQKSLTVSLTWENLLGVYMELYRINAKLCVKMQDITDLFTSRILTDAQYKRVLSC